MLPLPKEPTCSLCGKKKGYHKANTFACPMGTKTVIGYTWYHETNVFKAKKQRKPKVEYFQI
jgi:hypothetical protein